MDAKVFFDNLKFFSYAEYINQDNNVVFYLKSYDDRDETKQFWCFYFVNETLIDDYLKTSIGKVGFKTRKKALQAAQSVWLSKYTKPFDEKLTRLSWSVYYIKESVFSIQGSHTWQIQFNSLTSSTLDFNKKQISIWYKFMQNNKLNGEFKTRREAVEAFVEKYYHQDNKIKLFGLPKD